MKYKVEGYVEYAPKNDREWHFERKHFRREIMAKSKQRAEKKIELYLMSEIRVSVKRVNFEYEMEEMDAPN